MATYSNCPYCGAVVRSDQQNCPGCGAPNDNYVPERAAPDLIPGSIEELQDYCAAHQVPLRQLRFFIGEDCREPRSFGICRDGSAVVVYKIRSDGSRSVGYRGPDEERAVSMLYRKLLEAGERQRLLPADGGVWKAPSLPDGPPKTIEELQAFCRARNMPLRKMRFFLGEDCREPRAFGIYRDGDEVVVYKNKDDGSRAIRYRGRFEERGVRELYDKLLDECRRRGIDPEGAPVTGRGGSSTGTRYSGGSTGTRYSAGTRYSTGGRGGSVRSVKRSRFDFVSLLIEHPFRIFLVLILLGVILSSCTDSFTHRKDGYYQVPGDELIYYRYGDDWYYTYDENDTYYWFEADGFPETDYREYSLGDTWDEDWGVVDFRESYTWDELHPSSSGSSYDSSYDSDYDSWDSSDSDWGDSDYDSWDSGDTDWSSDW